MKFIVKRLKPTNSSAASKRPRPKRQSVAELRALQWLMAEAVTRPLTANGRMRPRWTDGRATKDVAANFIKPNDRLTSFDRLEIYNRQYWLRLIDCFYEDYSGLRAALGQERFHELALAYLTACPSTRFTLRDLGGSLIDFIAAEPRWTEPHQALALDMARLEWSHIEAFDNEGKPPVTAEDLLGREAARIHLQLQPHITLLRLKYPVDNYLLSLRENTRLRGEASNALEDADKMKNLRSARTRPVPLPKSRITWLAVHRHQNTVYYKRLKERQFKMLEGIQRGESLKKILEAVPPAAGLPVEEWFSDWAALGWFWMRR
jgi:hypothetical protein